MYVDLSEAELRDYHSSQVDPADFDEFWATTLDASRAAADRTAVSVVPVDTGLTTLDVFDVTFPGFGGQPVRGWLKVPSGREGAGSLPLLVEYVGYGGGRGRPTERL